jgi:hypothetical protein
MEANDAVGIAVSKMMPCKTPSVKWNSLPFEEILGFETINFNLLFFDSIQRCRQRSIKSIDSISKLQSLF